VYYAITSDCLLITLSEQMMKRALDRRNALARTPAPANPSVNPWLGTGLGLRIEQSFVPAIEALFRDELGSAKQQRLAWNNLPILNEWKRRYPGQDPVKVHEQFGHTTLVCPGGGSYVWNQQWQTMESTVYGSPAQPKPGSAKILPFANITSANLGLTFGKEHISAKVVIERAASEPRR
jgi:hypothetical protein